MADEFQTGVCGGSWWNSSRGTFGLSPCSAAINDIGSFGWPTDLADMKARSSDVSGSVSDGSIIFQDIQKPHHQPVSVSAGANISMDSTLQMMGIGLSSSTTTTDWNQALLHGSGRAESNYHSMLQEDLNSSLNYRQDLSPKNFSPGVEDSSVTTFKPMNQGLSLHEQCLNSVTSSGDCTVTCQGLPTSFPVSSSSYRTYPSTLLQTLFDTDPQTQQSLFANRSMNYPFATNYQTNLNEFSPPLPKFSSLLKPSLPKQQPTNHLQFSNNTPFWNASAEAPNDVRASPFPPSQSQFFASSFEQKPNGPNIVAKPNNNEEVRDLSSTAKKSSSTEPAFKRPRIETPSPLPTFKVRKEKLGDRITALQQLVSPFGKTDTASVLHEAIEYIKFLHDQVSVLSTPYMKSGAPVQRQQTPDHKLKDQEGPKQDLKSRGLCLVPISSTFPVAAETPADFWTPTFGGTFR